MPSRSLVVKITAGKDDPERCNQAFTVAATAGAAGLGEPLLTQLPGPFLVRAVQRLERPGCPAQQEIGEPGVTRERGPVQIGTEHTPGVRALGAVAIADADGNPRQRADARPEPGDALV